MRNVCFSMTHIFLCFPGFLPVALCAVASLLQRLFARYCCTLGTLFITFIFQAGYVNFPYLFLKELSIIVLNWKIFTYHTLRFFNDWRRNCLKIYIPSFQALLFWKLMFKKFQPFIKTKTYYISCLSSCCMSCVGCFFFNLNHFFYKEKSLTRHQSLFYVSCMEMRNVSFHSFSRLASQSLSEIEAV